jgi:hypothetical protein
MVGTLCPALDWTVFQRDFSYTFIDLFGRAVDDRVLSDPERRQNPA